MNATDFAMKIKAEMDGIKEAMVDPGFTDFGLYREALARFRGLQFALDKLRITINEDNE